MSNMPNEVIVLVHLFAFFLGAVVGVLGTAWAVSRNRRIIVTCPHGHSNWDECPVCCH